MIDIKIEELLDKFRSLPSETEWLEFKEAKNNFDFDDIGKYFSALSNEANLKEKQYGWLIFGVEDKKKKIVGTRYRPDRASLESLKFEIARRTTNNITFTEIHELHFPEGRVIMFQIPASPGGIPTAWEGHYYGRDGESLGALNLQEIEQIRNQVNYYDWSAQICKGASIKDLDEDAVNKAREKYKIRNKNKSFVFGIDRWDTLTFLDKARITINGEITNSAIILLGKPEATHYLSPSVAMITWKLDGEEKGYEHFEPPFFLTVNNIYQKIRNIKYKILPENMLVPVEVDKYDQWVILEALNNCIAHQNYSLRSRVVVLEKPKELIFINAGNFYEGTVEDYILREKTPNKYRNPFLVQAMVNLDMIDRIGQGIKNMFLEQKNKYFPLPEYDFSELDSVKLKVYGHIIDENYSRLLIERTDLDLGTVILLDKVQKGQEISKEAFHLLKKNRLVEGRYPKPYLTARIAATSGEKAEYIKYSAFNKQYYQDIIKKFLVKFKQAGRDDIDKLLMDKLPAHLNGSQKKYKINNLLNEMANKRGVIKNKGSRARPVWVSVEND
ncbi:MAG TPA: putative DNA binding domain-containing protein [Candidatus Eremiobacteraeota bacterium]|nr:MAG: Divergent AAA domain protein [bacterium ADurb.Bin363]HPZ07046.1 putative DNA binding domain-containing protein [Candidatus Eremiobacteraeota bacterium]